jgi:hypothetical protein
VLDRRAAALALVATTAAFALAPARVAAQSLANRLAIRGEFGLGTMFSPHQRDVLGYDQVDFGGALRVGFTVYEPLAVQASAAYWWFPAQQGTGGLLTVEGGVRFEPRVWQTLRVVAEGGAGVGLTGDVARVALELGLGAEVQPLGPLATALLLRYEHVLQDPSAPWPADAQAGFVVLQLSARSNPAPPSTEPDHRASARERVDPTPRLRPAGGPSPPRATRDDGGGARAQGDGAPSASASDDDTDGDGVIDMLDQCPRVPRGRRGDPRRLGCPPADLDHDGVPDHEDACPDVPEGDHADPNRPGCPEPDADHDGVPDRVDNCPEVPAGNHPRAGLPGCPGAHRGRHPR